LVAASFIVLIGVCAAAAPLLAPHHYAKIGFEPVLPPHSAHPMGTDGLGRDVGSRIIYGSRVSLGAGVISQGIALAIGLAAGVVAGFAGGRTDGVLMRVTDVMLALPPLLLALLLMAAVGRHPLVLFLAIGLAYWPAMARLVRGQVLQVRETEYVEAARAIGARPARLVARHIVPNIISPVIVQVTFGIPQAIMAEAFLSFIGVGSRPPTPSWGLMLADGFRWVRTSPHVALFPGLAISLTVLAFNFLGDGLRDAVDPKSRAIR
jgi:ABC-type dipeptide/oligopeptide/nickel transport system permease subunit